MEHTHSTHIGRRATVRDLNGNDHIGTITRDDADVVDIVTDDGQTLSIPRDIVATITPMDDDTQQRPAAPSAYIGKFDSARDAVVYRATLDGTCETLGDIDEFGFHASRVEDFYGADYIVIEDSQGFVTVEQFDSIAIDGAIGGGYYVPVERRWDELQSSIDDDRETAAMQVIADRVARDHGAPWPAHAWPGGYAIFYITDDGESLCADCVTMVDEIHFYGNADGWRIDGAGAYGADCDYPETDERCAHCQALICEGTGADDDDVDSVDEFVSECADRRNSATQQQQAETLRNSLVSDLERLERLEQLGRADDAADEFREEMQQRPLCADVRITVDVTLSTGGPASGIEFDVQQDSYGELELITARVWHQDWFTGKGYADLSDDDAQRLFDIYGIAYTEIGAQR